MIKVKSFRLYNKAEYIKEIQGFLDLGIEKNKEIKSLCRIIKESVDTDNGLKNKIKSLEDVVAVTKDASKNDISHLNRDIKELKQRLDKKNKRILELQDMVGDPIYLVRALTDKKLKFFDYEELDEQRLKGYYNEARSILKKPVFQNEIAYLKAQFLKWAGMQSRDYDGIIAMRHQISGIKLLEKRLEEIPDPHNKNKPTTEDLTSGL